MHPLGYRRRRLLPITCRGHSARVCVVAPMGTRRSMMTDVERDTVGWQPRTVGPVAKIPTPEEPPGPDPNEPIIPPPPPPPPPGPPPDPSEPGPQPEPQPGPTALRLVRAADHPPTQRRGGGHQRDSAAALSPAARGHGLGVGGIGGRRGRRATRPGGIRPRRVVTRDWSSPWRSTRGSRCRAAVQCPSWGSGRGGSPTVRPTPWKKP